MLLSEMILAGNNICRILLCIVLETKVPKAEGKINFIVIHFIGNWKI